MTRSRKRVPIVAHTKAKSDKPFKQQEHRRARRAAKIAVATGDEPPTTKEYGDEWSAPKDGKQYWPDKRAFRK